MSNLTLPSGIGDARMMAFLKALRDEIVELKARQGGDGCRVILREPDRRLHIQIVQSVIVEVTVCRFEHIRRGGVQSCQKAGAERHDCHNGQKAVETGADAPQNIYASCSFHLF